MNIFENVVKCLGDGMTQVLEDVERGAPVTRSQMLRLEKRIQELEKRLEKYEGREVKEEDNKDKDKDCNAENGSEVVGEKVVSDNEISDIKSENDTRLFTRVRDEDSLLNSREQVNDDSWIHVEDVIKDI